MRPLKIVAVVLLLTVGIATVLVVMLLGPANKSNPTTKEVTIVAGASRADIAKQLFQAELTRNESAMFAYLQFRKANVVAGVYEFSTEQSASIIAELMIAGKIKTNKITLIEGWRATDIEKYLVEEKKLVQFNGFAAQAESLEGYLFPDTYQIKVDETIDGLIKVLRTNFETRTKGLKVTPDVVNLAGIVEREAASDGERASIAGVYANRLAVGMKLQADPTIQYAKGNWKSVTLAEYSSVNSPYNTYLNEGLPPGPICNPGLKSIEAAINPEKHEYYFFFHAKGQTYFSKTYAEHSAKVKQYF